MKKRKLLSSLLAASLLCTTFTPAALAEDTNTQPAETQQASTRSGELTVTGGEEGVDYEWQDNVLYVKSSTALDLTQDNSERNVEVQVIVRKGINSNLNIHDCKLALRIGKNSITNVALQNVELWAQGNTPGIKIEVGATLNLDLSTPGEYISENICWDTISNKGKLVVGGSGGLDCEMSPGLGQNKNEGEIVVNGGYIRFSSMAAKDITFNDGKIEIYGEEMPAIQAENCKISNGNFYAISWEQRKAPLILADSIDIEGGTFLGGGDVQENSVYGCKVVDGKSISVLEPAEGYAKTCFAVVDSNQIPSLSVSGTGGVYKNRVLTLNDGANITVSSNGETNDYIQVGTSDNPAHAMLTLEGVNIHTEKPTINVTKGSSLTLKLKDGAVNSLESVGWITSAIHIDEDADLKICGNGTLNVEGSDSAIGTAYQGQIDIESGIINAKGLNGAAIGNEYKGYSTKVNIFGGTIRAEGGSGIGGGAIDDSQVHIMGGDITAIGSWGAGIGNRAGIINNDIGEGSSVIIDDGVVYATSPTGAAIGAGVNGSIEAIEINGGQIVAESESGAAIGSGSTWTEELTTRYDSVVDEINITGGHIVAKSKAGGAGIGGGKTQGNLLTNVGSIEISGGTVEAYSGKGANGIGAGKGGLGGTFTTAGGNPVILTNSISDVSKRDNWTGVFLVDDQNRGIGKVYGTTVTPTNDFTIPSGKTLEVAAGQKLIVDKDVTATNNGTVIRDKRGAVDVQGEWLGNPVLVKDGEEGSAVTGISLDKSALALQPGKSTTLTATVTPATAANKSVRWTSSDTGVATVDATGRVSAVAKGTAVITASTEDGGFTAQCTVRVSADEAEVIAVDGVSLDRRSVKLDVGETEKLSATVTPKDASNQSVKWKSNDENVVSVDATGKLTAIGSGTASVTVTTEDGHFTALCKVTVVDPDDKTTDTETKPDGSTVTTVQDKNGSSATTTVDKNGVSTTEVILSDKAVEQAAKNDTAAILPMVGVRATDDSDTAPSVTVDLPGRKDVQVEIPVLDMTPGTVAVLVDKNGKENVIPNSVLGHNGLIVTLSDGDTVKIVDNTQHYGDVADSHWAKNTIDYVTSRGLFVGVSDDSFAPETTMTRAMIVSVLQRYEGDDTAAAPGEDWYEGARQWAIANGVSDGSNMDGNVTREQLVTMLYRYAGSPKTVGSLGSYADNTSVSDFAQQAITWAVANGIISGMTADTLAPQGQATRAQVAAILQRFIEWEQV